MNNNIKVNNAKWFKKREHDKIAKFISALILAFALLNLHDMVFLLLFFYAAAIVGIVIMAAEIKQIVKKRE